MTSMGHIADSVIRKALLGVGAVGTLVGALPAILHTNRPLVETTEKIHCAILHAMWGAVF